MHRFLLIVVSFFASIASARADDRAKFEELESAWNEAHLRGDVAALDALWSHDVTIIVPGMAPMTKQDALALWKSAPVMISKYQSGGLAIRRVDKFSIVTGTIERSRSFNGRSANDRWRFTKIYQRQRGDWKVIHFHASALEEQ